MTREQPQYVRDHPSEEWQLITSRDCSPIHHPVQNEPSLLIWFNAQMGAKANYYAEHVGPHICIDDHWARFTRCMWRTGETLEQIGFASARFTPWQIDGESGPIEPGLRVQLHATNGHWLWVVQARAACGGWDAVWPD